MTNEVETEERHYFRITVRCKSEPLTHAKILTFVFSDEVGGKEYCETFAGLIDGTSRHYVYPPGPNSPIGKCGICQGELTTEVEEVSGPPHANFKK